MQKNHPDAPPTAELCRAELALLEDAGEELSRPEREAVDARIATVRAQLDRFLVARDTEERERREAEARRRAEERERRAARVARLALAADEDAVRELAAIGLDLTGESGAAADLEAMEAIRAHAAKGPTIVLAIAEQNDDRTAGVRRLVIGPQYADWRAIPKGERGEWADVELRRWRVLGPEELVRALFTAEVQDIAKIPALESSTVSALQWSERALVEFTAEVASVTRDGTIPLVTHVPGVMPNPKRTGPRHVFAWCAGFLTVPPLAAEDAAPQPEAAA